MIENILKGKSKFMLFQCNICGFPSIVRFENLAREMRSCLYCKSSVRFRSVIYALSMELFQKAYILPKFPVNFSITGIGLSDYETYARRLAKKLSYQNTYFHKEPRLDITNPAGYSKGVFDFLISSDVFEHVSVPVSRVFSHSYNLLRQNGILVLTVPYVYDNPDTLEHFPELFEYKIIKSGDRSVLINRTQDGCEQRFDNLVFHGGDGTTLEMRLFSKRSLIRELEQAGFREIKIYGDNFMKYGIYHGELNSLPIVAKK